MVNPCILTPAEGRLALTGRANNFRQLPLPYTYIIQWITGLIGMFTRSSFICTMTNDFNYIEEVGFTLQTTKTKQGNIA